MAVLLGGCSAQSVLRKKNSPPVTADLALHQSLDRFDHWTSLFARLKLSVSVHDTNFVALGHVMYLAGERYEVGFEKPYSRYLGTFYVAPNQFIYFDTHSIPTTYALKDTVSLSRLIPMGVPNWDPRDILPFPVSGRTSGFQVDSTRMDKDLSWVYGNGDRISYALAMSTRTGNVVQEMVQRAGRDLMLKKYERIKIIRGWPVATRVTCSNQAGDVHLTWGLSGVQLEAPELHPNESISTAK